MDGPLWIELKKLLGVTTKDEGPPKFSDQASKALPQFQGVRRSHRSDRSSALRYAQLARLSHAQERIGIACDHCAIGA